MTTQKKEKPLTIAEALEKQLGRKATHNELCEEVKRILRKPPNTI